MSRIEIPDKLALDLYAAELDLGIPAGELATTYIRCGLAEATRWRNYFLSYLDNPSQIAGWRADGTPIMRDTE